MAAETKPNVKKVMQAFFEGVLEDQECSYEECPGCTTGLRTPAETREEADRLAAALCSDLVDNGFIIAMEADY